MSRETYWKRRVFVLAGILIVVALIAWACSGPSGGGNGEQSASTDPEAGTESGASPTPEESPSPSPGEESDSEEEDGEDGEGGGEDEGSGGSGGGSGGDSGDEAGSASQGAADVPQPRRPEDPCRPQDVVVTLEATEETYTAGQNVKIRLSVVNTGEQTCTVDVGPKGMELRVFSGDDRVYSTADCIESGGSQNEQLRRGVPFTTTITWDRERSWADCRDQTATAGAGWYVAKLFSDYDEGAEDQRFRLT